ncbi:D-alanyl-D-alanine carboxypeptidase/D-alanyl-D-alanine-endopeptidase [Hyphomonas neptunium ATCC 15444]|uniref:D-alanyl-D-alanine carboxypeptidase/D-alanyl-D-alanine-endopeptidase n=2 Tax=Hyphomonas TaxID=85 RepID=Q0C561_HYPNA|nr:MULTISPECIES: D-alanyl-D-alanine carboxypeptidase/D-alanyl-D-alanine-endopeptidase [Hyphomonas]ABI76704.1 D-alanyl-D-alanine carboxypeptidase/D-alanyl-D-alanine-endopeptidase [Hyphomonas neptunium ATCC 15444]KCZ95565.1 D-alanyl-D-alanine carboxypeptidase/D-alanyl-D-alanine-endopeptidase [Hyphomonas hirschiana VP5]
MIRPRFLSGALAAVVFAVSACTTTPAEPPPPAPFEAMQVEGVRWGVSVMTLDGREVFSRSAEERFIPASNTKVFTSAAAFHYLTGLDTPDPAGGTSLWLEPGGEGEAPDLVLMGAGDPGLMDSADCVDNCLHQLADAVVAAGITRVGDVIGDDTLLPAALWGQGWSWNNFVWYYTAPISALTVNENTLGLTVSPGAAPGEPAVLSWAPGDDLLLVDNKVITGPPGSLQTLRMVRVPGLEMLRLTEYIPADAAPRMYAVAMHDPAETAALRFVRLLIERGVTVEGLMRARHEADDSPAEQVLIARLTPAPIKASIGRILVNSQNLHAELLLRKIALARGQLSPEGGQEVLTALVAEAGLTPVEAELFDGSGLSTYNRVTPRGMAQFLRWAAGQPWGDAWRAMLPVGGADGTLARRFKGTSLEGKVFAKTGSLHGVNALSGYMTARSGQTLVFAVYANDRPADAPSIIAEMDANLVRIAEAN